MPAPPPRWSPPVPRLSAGPLITYGARASWPRGRTPLRKPPTGRSTSVTTKRRCRSTTTCCGTHRSPVSAEGGSRSSSPGPRSSPCAPPTSSRCSRRSMPGSHAPRPASSGCWPRSWSTGPTAPTSSAASAKVPSRTWPNARRSRPGRWAAWACRRVGRPRSPTTCTG
jgi:hypothetical protein